MINCLTAAWPSYSPDEILTHVAREQNLSPLPPHRRLDSISSVRAIGATYEEDGRFSPRDTAIIKNSLRYLIRSGITISNDIGIDVMNLNEGTDYLEPKASNTAADLHIACYIFSPAYVDETQVSAENARLIKEGKASPRAGADFYHAQSPNHYAPGIWAASAARQGAKIIMTYGRKNWEINSQQFAHSPFLPILSTGQGISIGDTPHNHPYGLLMHNDFFTQCRSQIPSATPLGKIIAQSPELARGKPTPTG